MKQQQDESIENEVWQSMSPRNTKECIAAHILDFLMSCTHSVHYEAIFQFFLLTHLFGHMDLRGKVRFYDLEKYLLDEGILHRHSILLLNIS